jgi:hypothetical protein
MTMNMSTLKTADPESWTTLLQNLIPHCGTLYLRSLPEIAKKSTVIRFIL